MWKGYAPALTGYIWCISQAAKARGLDYITLDEQKMAQIAREAGVGPEIPYVIAEFMEDALPELYHPSSGGTATLVGRRPAVSQPPFGAAAQGERGLAERA